MYEHQVDEAASQDSTTEQPDSGKKAAYTHHNEKLVVNKKQHLSWKKDSGHR